MDRLRWAWVAWVIGIASGCHSQNAVLLTVTADAKVEQYQLFVHDDDAASVVYSSGFTSVSTPGQPALDLTVEPLKLALKLSRGGHFTLLLVGVIGEIQNGKPTAAATVLFWAGKVHVDGATRVSARLLTVPPGDDSDGDYFPDATDFLQHVPEAATLYAGKASVLDCDDKVDNPPGADGTPIALQDAEINPFATEICGDGYDENCDGDADEACVDKDGDHDVRGHDCDDSDPNRHHPTDIDPFPDPPNCCGYSLGMIGTADEHTNFLGQPICPMQRCGDGIDESCRGVANDKNNDTTCIVDADCDGYPAPPQGDDCDDNDPTVHPGAVEPCGATKDLNCNKTVGEGCVPCDLDGDGYERADAVNGCPDANDKHAGMVDCNDDDAGVFPGATQVTGGNEGGVSVGKVVAGLRGYCRNIYESTKLTGTAKINPFGGLVGDADCNGKAFEGCPALIDPGCDLDGDGWPGVATSNGKNCNPGNVTLDCDDNDPTTFPSAPVNCKSNRPTYKENCQPQGTPDCTGDADGDGYAAPADCDDKNAAVHPWAVELCDGIDNDCDGLIDEGNPDPSGAPLVAGGKVTSCTDSDTGECGKQKGSCVCSIAQPVKDPLLAELAQPRTMCPGEGSAAKAPSCFGAGQPKPQSCDATNPKDDDCDGRTDAPDGVRLAPKGMTCGITVGQCKAGIVVGCDSKQTNCFTQFGRTAPSTAWLVCSTAAPDPVTVCPTAEQCNGLDDDCDGQLAGTVVPPVPGLPTNDERDHDADHYIACSGCTAGALAAGLLGCGDCNDTSPTVHPGALELCNGIDDACAGSLANDGKDECGKGANATKTTCCGGNGCRDTKTDFQFCGSCTQNTCSLTTADMCVNGGCSCGTSGVPCGSGLTCVSGMCVAGNGATCTMNNQCQSGNCVDGHCCGVASCGTCKACTGANGTCVNQASGMAGNGCPDGNGNTVCDGNGACKKNLGQACTANANCYNGQCVDGYCCNSTCTGQCEACNLTGKLGMCSPVTGAPVNVGMPTRAPCSGGTPAGCAGSCDGTNPSACTYPGPTTMPNPCSPLCTPGSGGNPATVTPEACNGNNMTRGSCSASGPAVACANGSSKCNAAGDACAGNCVADADCVNSDYCSSTGGGTCTARNGNGTTCSPTNDCNQPGCRFCKASAPCQPSGQCCQNTCPAPVCTANGTMPPTYTVSTCNTSGTCSGANQGCNGYLCADATSCKTSCASDADCDTDHFCAKGAMTGTCSPRLGAGSSCGNSDCESSPCNECAAGLSCNGGTCK